MNPQKAHMLAVATETAALGFTSAAQAMKNFANDVYPVTVAEWARDRVELVTASPDCVPYSPRPSPFAKALIESLRK